MSEYITNTNIRSVFENGLNHFNKKNTNLDFDNLFIDNKIEHDAYLSIFGKSQSNNNKISNRNPFIDYSNLDIFMTFDNNPIF